MIAVLIGALCGAFGQIIRTAIGITKTYIADGSTTIVWQRIAAYGTIGALAGVVGALVHPDPLFLVACGYAGTDAIEGILKAAGPKA